METTTEREFEMEIIRTNKVGAQIVADELRAEGEHAIARFRSGIGWHVLVRPWA